MKFRRLEDAIKKKNALKGKTALVRVDFNVPRNKDGSISDDTRLQASIPTIKALQKGGAKIVLLSHYGRPKGKPDPKMSLSFIVPALVEALDDEVSFSEKLSEPLISTMEAGDVLLIENTRFTDMETLSLIHI